MRASEEIGVKYMQAWEEKYYDKKEAREEGLAEGLALGRSEGEQRKLCQLIEKKLAKGKSIHEIADDLEEEEENIRKLVDKLVKPSAGN